MNLKGFYDEYALAADKSNSTLNKERKTKLIAFQAYCIKKAWVTSENLKLSPDGRIMQTSKKLELFHYRLLAFYLRSANESNWNKEPIISIRVYFELYKDDEKIKNIARYAYDSKLTFAYSKSMLEMILADYLKALRDPMRIHHKFLRTKKSLKAGSVADGLKKEIEARIIGKTDPKTPINVDNKPSRSVIMALHKTMEDLAEHFISKPPAKPWEGKAFYFEIGITLIEWMPVNNHGKVFLQMQYTGTGGMLVHGGNGEKLLHKFPYGKELADRLAAIEAKLSIKSRNLMALILTKFSVSIEGFKAKDFEKPITAAEIHFLNAFSFLIQIAELARYLPSAKGDRAIETSPLSMALAVSKFLKRDGIISWSEIYGDCPPSIKAEAKAWGNYNRTTRKYKPDATAYGGLDPASGHSIGIDQNKALFEAKLSFLAAKKPGYWTAVASAGHVRSELERAYGTGSESDSDDSVYTLGHIDSESLKAYGELACEKLAIWHASEDRLIKPEDEVYSQLSSIATELGYHVEDVKGDGNCFLHAVVDQLNNLGLNAEGWTSDTLRPAAVHFALNNWLLFSEFIPDPHDFFGRVTEDGEWADNEIIAAVAYRLGVNIEIHRNDGEAVKPIAVGGASTLHLGYINQWHYVSFRPGPKPVIAGTPAVALPVMASLSLAADSKKKVVIRLLKYSAPK
ncbi:MAG: hypothetical protein Q7V63_01810 [Gammaproteobacteria bacterium]|nr:hypothetical protein [Gammaproteobacteria bacterium]